MTTAKYSIFPVNAADIPVLVELLYSLKTALTFNRVLFKHWPNEAAQKALYRATLENTLAQITTIESLKAVDDETGEIIGYVAVSRESPIRNPTEQQKQHSNAEGGSGCRGQEQIEDLNDFHPEVYAAAIRACLELQRRNEPFEHFEITYVGVKPTCRKRGIGAKLIQECFYRAEKAGIPLTLNAEPEALDFYLKLGFTETGHADIDLAQWATPNSGLGNFRWTGMIWHP